MRVDSEMSGRISGEEVCAAGCWMHGIAAAVADLGPSSWVKGRVNLLLRVCR